MLGLIAVNECGWDGVIGENVKYYINISIN